MLGAHISLGFAALMVSGTALAQTPISTSVHISGSCQQCDLSNRSMPRISLQGSDFSGSDFSNSNLSGGKFHSSNLSHTIFQKAYLLGINGKGVNFSNTNLRDATLTNARLQNSDISNADLKRADLTKGYFKGSNFSHSSLKSVDAMNAMFKGAYFSESKLDHGNFSGSDFTKAQFIDTKFGDAILESAIFDRTEFMGANLSKVIGLTQEQINTSCGDEETELPTGLTLMNCADRPDEEEVEENTFFGFSVPPASPFAVKSAEAPSFRRSYQSAVRSDIRILITDNDQQHPILQKRRAKRADRKEALEDALKGIDAAMRDLPIDSPTRAKLSQSREILQNIQDTE
jgi:uncharacterized protein YjbI with pentapeptide repeats